MVTPVEKHLNDTSLERQQPIEISNESKKIQKTQESPEKSQKDVSTLKKKHSKPKTKILGGHKKPNPDEDFIFYDPLHGSIDSNLCMSCHRKKIEVLNLPCGHSCCCQNCFSRGGESCLFCNAIVKNFVFLNMATKTETGDEDQA